MRNLKRVLSLALACVMVIGMMVMTTGAADFTDTDEITNTAAVEALVTLGVINGRDDGSFDPQGTVTRAEMAKMICIVHNGGKDPLLGAQVSTMFTDTVNHWAKAYIAYATNLGVIAGLGDGTFAPDATVTGTQAAKMLLVALGYDPDVFGLVGTEWDTSTEVIANNIDLFDGLETIALEKGLTRENAAQMIFNALNANIMVKTYDKVLSNGQISYNYALDEYKTLLNDTYGAWKVEGVVQGNEYALLSTTQACMADGKTKIAISNADELVVAAGGVTALTIDPTNDFWVTTGAEELGKTIILYVKPAQSSKATLKATVIGGAILSDVNTVVTKDNQIKAAPMLNNMLTKAGLESTMPAGEYYVNGVKVPATYSVAGPGAAAENVNGYYTQFIDNDGNGYVDYVLVDKIDFGKVSYYNTDKGGEINVKTGSATYTGKYKGTDTVGFENVAKNDFVLYQEIGGRLYVEKAPYVTGKLTDYSKQDIGTTEAADSNLWIDGEKYTNSGAGDEACDTTLASYKPEEYTTLGVDATFYLDACGYVVAINGTVQPHYAIATYADSNAHVANSLVTAPHVQVTFEDGTSKAVKYDTDDTLAGYRAIFTEATVASDALEENSNHANEVVLGSYTYTPKGELKMTPATLTASAGNFKYTSGNILVTDNGANLNDGSGKNVYMTDSTVVYFVTTQKVAGTPGAIATTAVDKVATYVGKDNVPSVELTSGYLVQYMINARNEIVAMAVIAPSINSIGNNYLYVVDVVSTAAKTKVAVAVVGGEVKEITINSLSNQTIDTLTPYEYIMDGENYELTDKLTDIVTFDYIERVNTNDRTVVVNGVEYKVATSCDIANLGDEEVLVLEDLNVGDLVSVLHDTNTPVSALGIYVHEAYNEGNANILGIVTDDGDTAGEITVATFDKKDIAVTAKTSLKENELLAALIVSGGVDCTAGGAGDVKVYTDSACTTEAANYADTVADGAVVYVKLTADDGSTNVYTVTITLVP